MECVCVSVCMCVCVCLCVCVCAGVWLDYWSVRYGGMDSHTHTHRHTLGTHVHAHVRAHTHKYTLQSSPKLKRERVHSFSALECTIYFEHQKTSTTHTLHTLHTLINTQPAFDLRGATSLIYNGSAAHCPWPFISLYIL